MLNKLFNKIKDKSQGSEELLKELSNKVTLLFEIKAELLQINKTVKALNEYEAKGLYDAQYTLDILKVSNVQLNVNQLTDSIKHMLIQELELNISYLTGEDLWKLYTALGTVMKYHATSSVKAEKLIRQSKLVNEAIGIYFDKIESKQSFCYNEFELCKKSIEEINEKLSKESLALPHTEYLKWKDEMRKYNSLITPPSSIMTQVNMSSLQPAVSRSLSLE